MAPGSGLRVYGRRSLSSSSRVRRRRPILHRPSPRMSGCMVAGRCPAAAVFDVAGRSSTGPAHGCQGVWSTAAPPAPPAPPARRALRRGRRPPPPPPLPPPRRRHRRRRRHAGRYAEAAGHRRRRRCHRRAATFFIVRASDRAPGWRWSLILDEAVWGCPDLLHRSCVRPGTRLALVVDPRRSRMGVPRPSSSDTRRRTSSTTHSRPAD